MEIFCTTTLALLHYLYHHIMIVTNRYCLIHKITFLILNLIMVLQLSKLYCTEDNNQQYFCPFLAFISYNCEEGARKEPNIDWHMMLSSRFFS